MDTHAGSTIHGFMPRKKYLPILFGNSNRMDLQFFALLRSLRGEPLIWTRYEHSRFLSSQPPTAMSSLISSFLMQQFWAFRQWKALAAPY